MRVSKPMNTQNNALKTEEGRLEKSFYETDMSLCATYMGNEISNAVFCSSFHKKYQYLQPYVTALQATSVRNFTWVMLASVA